MLFSSATTKMLGRVRGSSSSSLRSLGGYRFMSSSTTSTFDLTGAFKVSVCLCLCLYVYACGGECVPDSTARESLSVALDRLLTK